jgi:hypothetical protein
MANLSLAMEEPSQARAHVEEILELLGTETLEGTGDPFWVHLTCYRVLYASQDPRAPEILAAAHALLQERAARIDDQGLRRSFLGNVPAHREIMRTYANR